MDLKSEVAKGLDLRTRGEVTISHPWERHLPAGTPPKDHPGRVPGALGRHGPPGPRDPTSPRRPREPGAGEGALGRGATAGGRGGHWGKVPPAWGPHKGRGAASPGGQRPRSAASRPPRGRGCSPVHRPPAEMGSEFPAWGSILARDPPLSTALLPTHSRTPRLTLSGVQMARGAQQQRGQRHRQQRGRGPPRAPGAHGCGSAGSWRIRAHGARPPGPCSEAAAGGAARSPLPRRRPPAAEPAAEGPRSGSRRGARPRPLPIQRRGPGPSRDLGAWIPALRPGLLALGPERSGPRSADARPSGHADRKTDGRASTWAGGWRAGGERVAGARTARPVNNAARQLGPAQAVRKDGADPNSEGTRARGEAGAGWREARGGRCPPRSAGRRAGGSGHAPAQGRPRSLPNPRGPAQSLGAPQMPNPGKQTPCLTFC